VGVRKLSNVGGWTSKTIYTSMLAGNAVFVPNLPTDYDSIATVTLGSTQSSITFSSIPSTYTHLQMRFMSRDNRASSANGVRMRFNGDSGNNYSWHYLIGNGSATAAGAAASNDAFYVGEEPANSAPADIFSVGIVDILDYTNTSKNKTIKSLQGYDTSSSNGAAEYWSGTWYNTSAVNSLTVFFDGSASAIQYSQFALYGVKGQ